MLFNKSWTSFYSNWRGAQTAYVLTDKSYSLLRDGWKALGQSKTLQTFNLVIDEFTSHDHSVHLFHNVTFMVRKQCWYSAGITDDNLQYLFMCTFISLFEEIQEMGLIFPSDQLSQVRFPRYIFMNNTHTHTHTKWSCWRQFKKITF